MKSHPLDVVAEALRIVVVAVALVYLLYVLVSFVEAPVPAEDEIGGLQ